MLRWFKRRRMLRQIHLMEKAADIQLKAAKVSVNRSQQGIMTTTDPTFPGFEPEAAEINEAHEIWGTPKATLTAPSIPTVHVTPSILAARLLKIGARR